MYEDEDDGDDSYLLVYNHQYVDLYEFEFDVDEILQHDRELIQILPGTPDPDESMNRYLALAWGEDPDDADFDGYSMLWNRLSLYAIIDPGVASTVAALEAVGAHPFASCNGGIFGDFHHEKFPLVVFLATPSLLTSIRDVARKTNVKITETEPGHMVHSESISNMHAFATALVANAKLP